MLGAIDEQQFAGHRLRARIGIDTGPVVAGAVGAAGRLSYTVYGNSVNLAARLEQLNKTSGTYLLISENTAKLAGDVDGLRAVGKTLIRGQTALMKTYTLATASGSSN
jgi:class 3 adenylate cyclase